MTNEDFIRKQEFKNEINKLCAETDHDIEEPRSWQEALETTKRLVCDANILQLKEFVDRNYEGEKSRLIVSTPYKGENTGGKLGDVVFMSNGPEYNQMAFDTLKNFNIVPEDSQLSDYAFLFPSDKNQK